MHPHIDQAHCDNAINQGEEQLKCLEKDVIAHALVEEHAVV